MVLTQMYSNKEFFSEMNTLFCKICTELKLQEKRNHSLVSNTGSTAKRYMFPNTATSHM